MSDLLGAATTTLLFGPSRTFAWALTMRTEVRAFGIFSGSWNIEQITGQFLVNVRCCSNLDRRYADIVNLLLCLVSAMYTFSAIVPGLFSRKRQDASLDVQLFSHYLNSCL